MRHEKAANPSRVPQSLSLVLVCVLVLAGCNSFSRKVAMDDPRIQPLLQAAESFDRTTYEFTPIPKTGEVSWESKPTSRYDAMLHIGGRTSRTIAFRKAGSGWRWIGDQEIFNGPKIYKSVDGTFPEQICLTYETESVSGFSTNQLNITYSGEDARLQNRTNLTLANIKPILKEWGY